jgi:hypothetical protein
MARPLQSDNLGACEMTIRRSNCRTLELGSGSHINKHNITNPCPYIVHFHTAITAFTIRPYSKAKLYISVIN